MGVGGFDPPESVPLQSESVPQSKVRGDVPAQGQWEFLTASGASACVAFKIENGANIDAKAGKFLISSVLIFNDDHQMQESSNVPE